MEPISLRLEAKVLTLVCTIYPLPLSLLFPDPSSSHTNLLAGPWTLQVCGHLSLGLWGFLYLERPRPGIPMACSPTIFSSLLKCYFLGDVFCDCHWAKEQHSLPLPCFVFLHRVCSSSWQSILIYVSVSPTKLWAPLFCSFLYPQCLELIPEMKAVPP